MPATDGRHGRSPRRALIKTILQQVTGPSGAQLLS
jgi:hypothetical protein